MVTGRTRTPVRILKNAMARAYVARERRARPRWSWSSLPWAACAGPSSREMKNGSLMAGQVSGMLREIRPLRAILMSRGGCGAHLRNWNRRFSHESGFSVCGTGHPAPGDGAGSL